MLRFSPCSSADGCDFDEGSSGPGRFINLSSSHAMNIWPLRMYLISPRNAVLPEMRSALSRNFKNIFSPQTLNPSAKPAFLGPELQPHPIQQGIVIFQRLTARVNSGLSP